MDPMSGLYNSCPALWRTDQCAGDGLEERKWILPLVPKHSVGAELGVFTGLFSEAISEAVQPKRLYLVDVWWTQFGEYYPDWNVYTDFGRLPTRVAYEAAVTRTTSAMTEVIPIVSNSIAWARSIPDFFLIGYISIRRIRTKTL